MNILLYIPPSAFSIDSNRELVTALDKCLNESWHCAITHQYQPKMLDDVSLLHIFGCWNHEAAKVMSKATKAGVPTVYSPLGGLEPWTMKGKNAKRKLQATTYQRNMTRQASAVHVGGRFEQEMFNRLKWNNKIAVIKNPAFTSLVSPQDMTEEMKKLYQKVFDSNVYTLMSEKATKALTHLIHAAINPKITNMPIATKEALKNIQQIDDTDWRNICIYARDEHITDYLKKGAAVMQYHKDIIVVEEDMRFVEKSRYADGDVKSDGVLSSNIMLKSKVEDIASDDDQAEFELCMAVLNIRHEITHNTLPLRHVVNLAEKLLNNNYDEDLIATMLSTTGSTNFMSRLEAAMENITHLTEGFMPIKPIFDKQADEITTKITKLKTSLS